MYAVYICLLVLAGLQFVIAYQNISAKQMFVRMLGVAQSSKAAWPFCFSCTFRKIAGLRWFVLIFTVAVLLGLQYGWTDSFRLINGVPWAK